MTDKTGLLNHSLNELLPHGVFSDLLHQIISLLEKEDVSYRPVGVTGTPGGLIDLVGMQGEIPTMIVPDLHCRGEFFQKILRYIPEIKNYHSHGIDIPENLSVIDLLEAGKINLVCVGDGLHSELHKDRWLIALDEYEKDQIIDGVLKEEMAEGLSLMSMIMKCKISFPRNFHFLKGNHENIMNHWKQGDRPFKKYAKEGEMSRRFMEEYYGDDILYLYSQFESLLPLFVKAPRCLISHSEPSKYFSESQIINCLEDGSGQVIYGLTWTKNDDSEEGAVATMLQELLPQWWNLKEGEETSPSSLYFGGHRSISDIYRLRQDGYFVQFHNPRNFQVALVPVHRPFDFNQDIIQL